MFGNHINMFDNKTDASNYLKSIPVKSILTVDGGGKSLEFLNRSATTNPNLTLSLPLPEAPQMTDAIKKTTKAEQVRDFIRAIKPKGGTKEEVVAFCVELLGMKKPLAKTYAQANWDRV